MTFHSHEGGDWFSTASISVNSEYLSANKNQLKNVPMMTFVELFASCLFTTKYRSKITFY